MKLRHILTLHMITAVVFACAVNAYGAKSIDKTLYWLFLDNLDSDRERAMEYAEDFLNSIKDERADSSIVYAAEKLSDYYGFEKFLYSQAVKWRIMALEACKALGDEDRAAVNEFELALFYIDMEQYHKTLIHINEARRHFEKTSQMDNLLECYNVLGIVYNICRDDSKSKEYFNLYIQGAREGGDSLRMVNALHNLVMAYPDDPVKNDRLFEESIRICERTKDTAKLCKLYMSTIGMSINSADFDKARQSLEKVRPLIASAEDSGSFHLYNGLIHNATGDKDGAIAMLREALSIFRRGEFASKQMYCLDALQEIYSEKGNYLMAYRTLNEYTSRLKEDNSQDMYIELFKAESNLKRIAEEEASKRCKATSAAIAISVILIIIIIMLSVSLWLRKKSFALRQKENELASKNEILELRRLQQYQMDMLTKEIIDKLHNLSDTTGDAATKNRIQRMCSELVNSKDDEQWKSVSKFVPEFNSVFYQNLLKDFPDLTVNERRLCALLNLNLSTKEISEITRQSPHSINVARSRLRSKLNISGNSTSIQEFLSKYNSTE